jgi:hypothetical protein
VHAYASGRKATLRHIRHIANVNGKRQGNKKFTLQGNKWDKVINGIILKGNKWDNSFEIRTRR